MSATRNRKPPSKYRVRDTSLGLVGKVYVEGLAFLGRASFGALRRCQLYEFR